MINRCQSILILVFLLTVLSGTAWSAGALQFRVTQPADGILVLTELSPWESNHVVLVTEKGLVLVDPGAHPIIAEAIRKTVQKELGRSDFAYIINHHHHWGHAWANASFPEAVVIGHEDSEALMELAAGDRAATIGQQRQVAEQVRKTLETAKLDRNEANEARLSLAHAERAIAGLSREDFLVRTPDITFSDRMSLDLGNMTLEISFIGRGHSETDTMIFIPERGVLLMGCFFFKAQNLSYFGFTRELDVDRWLRVWTAILDGDAELKTVVLGQYEIWESDKLRLMRKYVASLWHEVRRLEAEGLDLAAAQEKLPRPAILDALLVDGVGEDDLQRYHSRNVTIFWRQFKTSAAELVGSVITDQGLEAGLAKYKALMESKDKDCFFDESEFNLLGYRFLQQEKYEEAIAVFKLNVEAYAESWNVYDSLGEAYMNRGDRKRAIECYEKSIEINPDNTNGIAKLEQLRARE